MNCQICGTELPPGAMFCGECGSAVNATVQSRRRAEPGDTSIVRPIRPRTSGIISVPFDTSPPLNAPDAMPPATAAREVLVPDWSAAVAPATAPSPMTARPAAALFVFTVSTGQVVSITGGGILGRRPMAQPGEVFDQLVQITDLTMSVSKNHFEFGQSPDEEGELLLWVNDRFSGNGTVLSRPGEASLRLEPGRRMVVPRGSRLDIGELFITVS